MKWNFKRIYKTPYLRHFQSQIFVVVPIDPPPRKHTSHLLGEGQLKFPTSHRQHIQHSSLPTPHSRTLPCDHTVRIALGNISDPFDYWPVSRSAKIGFLGPCFRFLVGLRIMGRLGLAEYCSSSGLWLFGLMS